MTYVPYDWINGSSQANAEHLNHIEEGIRAAQEATVNLEKFAGLQNVVCYAPEEFGAARNGKVIADGEISSSSKNFKSKSAKFTAADVGKYIAICGANSLRTGGAAGEYDTLVTKIAAYKSAEEVELAAEAKHSVTGALCLYATDDTKAINEAVEKAVKKCQEAGTYYCEVVLSNGIYGVAGSLSNAQKGNAQIPLPLIESTEAGTSSQGAKVTLVLRGNAESTALPLWYQKLNQTTGCMLFSFGPGGKHQEAYSKTLGRPAIIGGPAPEQGYSDGHIEVFSNMLYYQSGVSMGAPTNATLTGLELNGIANMVIPNLGSFALGVPGFPGYSGINAFLLPAAGIEGEFASGYESSVPRFATALAEPLKGNNDNSYVGTHVVEGHTTGIEIGEHAHHDRITTAYTYIGGVCGGIHAWLHGSTITHWSCEATKIGLASYVATEYSVPLIITLFDTEGGWTRGEREADVYDTHNALLGNMTINFNTTAAYPPKVTGAVGYSVKALRYISGPQNEPSIPSSSGEALLNPFWRDAYVQILGGTVTKVEVGAQVVATSTPCQVFVPAGWKIKITWSGKPTSWIWTTLS